MNIVVLAGGNSHEAEVSRVSAREVGAALERAGHTVTLIELDTDLTDQLRDAAPDVVFPALHGPPGEDGTIQGYLEMLQLPYVGSGVHGSATAMDKNVAKAVFRRHGLPVAADLVFPPGTDVDDARQQIAERIGERVVIKPLSQGSALGVTPLANGGDLTDPLTAAFGFGGGVLVEPYVLGREITVGVLDLEGEAAIAFPVIEIRTAVDEWYDYTNRYQAGASEHIVPAPMSSECAASLQEIALSAHKALGLKDLSRADFIVTDSEEIVLLEVNSMPGMTPTSLYPDGARAFGLSFEALLDALVESALRRAT